VVSYALEKPAIPIPTSSNPTKRSVSISLIND